MRLTWRKYLPFVPRAGRFPTVLINSQRTDAPPCREAVTTHSRRRRARLGDSGPQTVVQRDVMFEVAHLVDADRHARCL